ncbi:hypothetical protein LguiB_005568 [Lonicera macranthoides]
MRWRKPLLTAAKFLITVLFLLGISELILGKEMVDKESNSTSSKILVKVGVVLDTDIGIGKMSLRCIKMALSDFYASHPHYKTRLLLSVRNSNATVVGAAVAGMYTILSLNLLTLT